MCHLKKGSPDPKAKQNAIDDIKGFLSQIPASKRKQVMAVAGFKSITPEGFLREVEKETEFGRQIIDMYFIALKLDVELFELHLQELLSPLADAIKKAISSIAGKSESSTENRKKAIGKNTKNLLFIRPNIPDDNYTNQFAAPAAQLVYDKAKQEGWNITDLSGPQATEKNVTTALKNNNIDFVLHYDHGNTSALIGWNKKPVIDSTNVKYLINKGLSSVSCFPAFPILGIGQRAIDSGARAFLGYDSLHCCESTFQMVFMYCANTANYALLEGKTFLESYTIGLETYKTELEKISKSNDVYSYPAYVLLASDSWHFKLLSK